MGQVIYYKVGQSLLQSGVGIIKWGNYYRKGQYIFVTLGQTEFHVYRQGQCVRRLKFIRFKRGLTNLFMCAIKTRHKQRYLTCFYIHI